ncbi:MAG: phosphatidylinositol-specific phospholipase C/glycerophosphodiester phosphodiesterase family protein [Maribacter sp.]
MIQKYLSVLVILSCTIAIAQPSKEYAVHSHNDYEQNIPFWKAISAEVNSLEADIFLVGDSLFVAHTLKEIKHNRDLETLYLKPLRQAIELNLLSSNPLQLLIDVKSEAYSTLELLVKVLEKYPTLISNEKITFVISGKHPKLEDYKNYPKYILFDYQSLDPVPSQDILDKIALISLSFKRFSKWNGKGSLTDEDLELITKTIQKAHDFEKPFRFWGTPDSETAWKTFEKMGVDYINTDSPFECVQYLRGLPKQK